MTKERLAQINKELARTYRQAKILHKILYENKERTIESSLSFALLGLLKSVENARNN